MSRRRRTRRTARETVPTDTGPAITFKDSRDWSDWFVVYTVIAKILKVWHIANPDAEPTLLASHANFQTLEEYLTEVNAKDAAEVAEHTRIFMERMDAPIDTEYKLEPEAQLFFWCIDTVDRRLLIPALRKLLEEDKVHVAHFVKELHNFVGRPPSDGK